MEVQETLEEIFEALNQLEQKRKLYEALNGVLYSGDFTNFQNEYIETQINDIDHDIYFYKRLLNKKMGYEYLKGGK